MVDIIIKNEFTNLNDHSRGSTPGTYLVNYASRLSATEQLQTFKYKDNQQLDSYMLKYMARSTATEQSIDYNENSDKLEQKLNDEPLNGRAFGNNGVSYNQEQLLDAAKNIQNDYDNGHTVLKTVISFDTEFLKQHDILPKDYVHEGRGSFFGNVDQMKLRHSINNGLEKMCQKGGFIDPEWVATVQLDTNHVHCHIALSESSNDKDSRIMPDGTERGKINKNERDVLRKGIETDLLDMRPIRSLHHEIDKSKQDILTNLDELVGSQYVSDTRLQELVASLPEKRNLWRMKTNAKSMRKSKELVNDYLDTLLDQNSAALGYDIFKNNLQNYADDRARQEGKGKDRIDELIENGETDFRNRMGNRIFKQLKSIPQSDINVSSDYLEDKVLDKDVLKDKIKKANDEDIDDPDVKKALFEYKRDDYKTRLNKHLESSDNYFDSVHAIDKAFIDYRGVNPNSYLVTRNFYKSQLDYHMQSVDKYRYLIAFNNDKGISEPVLKQNEDLRDQKRYFDKDKYLHDDVQEFIDDDRFSKTLEFKDDNGISVKDHLNEYLNGSRKIISKKVANKIDQSASVLDEVKFKGLGTRVMDDSASDDEQSLDEQGPSMDQFLYELNENTYQCWRQGLLDRDDVQDFYENHEKYSTAELSEKSNVIPDVPYVDFDYDFHDPDHFSDVRGVDLSDLSYDFIGTHNRVVSDTVLDQFDKSVKNRHESAFMFKDMLEKVGNNSSNVDEVLLGIDYDQRVLNDVKLSHELPIYDLDVDPELLSKDAKTVSRQKADEIVDQHIQSVRNDSTSPISDNSNDDLQI